MFQLARSQFKFCKMSKSCGLTKVNIKSKIGLFDHLPPSSSKGLRSWRRMEWFLAVWIYPTQIYHRHSLFPGFVFFITSTKLTPRISDYSFALWPKNTHIYSLSHYPCQGSRLICLIWQHQQHLNPVSYVDFYKGVFVRLFKKNIHSKEFLCKFGFVQPNPTDMHIIVTCRSLNLL